MKDFKAAIETTRRGDQIKVVFHVDRKPPEAHKDCCNAPSTEEVGVVIVGQTFEKRDILLQNRVNNLIQIYEIHWSYDALQYLLVMVKTATLFQFLR